ncbi:MAG TPA: 50S ribosomal protein L23 [Candidatus Paceibacterota bacterium]|nr:50S ribosomal protein L23 [Candidatus Paceibacterota bacterium]
MALFGRKKNTEKKTEKAVKSIETKDSVSKKTTIDLDVTKILKNPRVSEKAAVVAESANAYIFDVYNDATKSQIKLAIEKVYKVIPLKVNISQVMSKKVRVRGTNRKTGVKSGGKKAFVYLKKGEKIEFI